MTNTISEPLIRIVKRDYIPFWKAWLIRVCSFAVSLLVCSLFIITITSDSPLQVFESMFDGAFGTERRSWITIRDIMTLLCVAVALAPAFKMRFWNIGAEGQVLMGGIATVACMKFVGEDYPTWLLFLLMIVTSCIAGAVWGLVPALFKAYWNTNETLFTLMMNYVAIQLTGFAVSKWEVPFGSNTVPAFSVGRFPEIFGQKYSLNIILVLALTIFMFFYLKSSKHGYEISVVGESENTARYAGINVKKVFMRTMLISGSIAGLAGFICVSGVDYTISTNTAGGRGFTAIIVAWLSKFNTFVMIGVTFLLVFLDRGAVEIASKYSLNEYSSEVITGIILFFILGSEFFVNYKLHLRGKKEVK